MSGHNPFIDRNMIWDPKRFFGRKREVEQIFERLEAMQSVSVVGKRRIGKSSLLAFIRATGSEKLGDGYEFHYIDLQGLEDTDDFIQRVLDALDTDGKTRRDLDHAIKTRQVILCIDEFEWSASFSRDFFGILRSLASTGNMALLIASQHKLADLTVDGTRTSPLSNIFTSRQLRGMDEIESGELLNGLGAPVGKSFPPDVIHAAHRITDGNPLKLQILGYHLFATDNDIDEARERYEHELDDFSATLTAQESDKAPSSPQISFSEPTLAERVVGVLLLITAISGLISMLTSSLVGMAITAVVGVSALIIEALRVMRRRRST